MTINTTGFMGICFLFTQRTQVADMTPLFILCLYQ